MLPNRFIVSFFFLVVVGLSSTASVSADPLTVIIANQTFQTVPGGTFLLSGTLTNTTSSILFVNSSGAILNINQPPGSNIVLDVTLFIRPNLTTFILQPGQSTTQAVPLISFLINPAAPDPSFTSGFLQICGGADPLACDRLADVPFTIAVSTDPFPEPTTILLLGTGLAAMATRAHRRRSGRNKP